MSADRQACRGSDAPERTSSQSSIRSVEVPEFTPGPTNVRVHTDSRKAPGHMWPFTFTLSEKQSETQPPFSLASFQAQKPQEGSGASSSVKAHGVPTTAESATGQASLWVQWKRPAWQCRGQQLDRRSGKIHTPRGS